MKVDFLPSDAQLDLFTAEERPDLWEEARPLFADVWPEYNNHGNNTGPIFSSLIPRHAPFQVLLYDREFERIVARGRTIPLRWDGSLDDLPPGLDAAGDRALNDDRPATCLCALAAEVESDLQGQGLSRLVLQAMAATARAARLSPLIAPVRPSWKDRYPLIPIERYWQWSRADGLPFDPWMRVHARLGAVVLRPEARSLQIEAPASDWASWTNMEFPEDGTYVFPFGLAPLSLRDSVGSYWEPNVWMLHDVS